MKSILWSDHLSVSATKRNLILSTFGKAGQNWLNELEATHINATNHWGLTFVTPNQQNYDGLQVHQKSILTNLVIWFE